MSNIKKRDPLKRYPVYKNSGTPGAGQIPEKWATDRIKAHVHNIVDLTKKRDTKELYVALENVESWTGKIREQDEEVVFNSQVKKFMKGDILFGKLRPYLAKVTTPERSGVCVGEFLVLRPQNSQLETKYLEHFMRSKPLIDAVDASTFGARMPRADWAFIGNIEIPLPPLPEQAAIVRFLDHADQQIQRYIAAKKRLIELLEERRQAVIHQAVTRGLDPDVKLKDSGIEWLGDVPEHWEVRRLRNLGEALIGLTYDPQDVVSEGDGMLVLRASNILDGQLVYGDNVCVRTNVPETLVTREGDILICSRSGSRALVGKNALISAESAGTTFGAFMTVFRSRNNDYIHQVFNSGFFERQSAIFSTSTVNQLTLGMIKNMKVPFPPAYEQAAIVEYIDQATAGIDSAIARARRQIELLEEYRTRLMADVVTGKLDVRNITL